MSAEKHHQYVFPDDSRWDDARLSWNLAADLRPAVVVLPTTVEDVVGAVEYATERDLKVVVQGTGHGASVHGSLDGTLLLNMREMRAVEIDAENRRARVEAGALWEDVVVPATEQGLTALHGSSPNVGVVGYSLGGGIGWLARKHGLSAESVLAVEVVTADGTLLRADRTQNTELFWALRGGGGGLGVVVAMEIALYQVEELVAGMMIWPWEQSAEVLTAYVEWAQTAPNSVSTSARMLQIPPLPDIPEFLRGRQIVVIDGAVLGNEDEANEILAAVPRSSVPRSTRSAPVPAAALMRLHMDPEPPMPGKGDGCPGRRPRRRCGQGDRRRPRVPAPTRRSSWSSCGSSAGRSVSVAPARARSARSTARSRSSRSALPMGPGAAEAIEQRIERDQAARSHPGRAARRTSTSPRRT